MRAVNDLADEGQEGVRRAYGAGQLARLATLKDRYDPENIFHLNHNIPADQPATGAGATSTHRPGGR